MLLYQLEHVPGRRVEAMLADDGHLDATLVLDAQHLLDGLMADLHRLFDDDMAATAHGLTSYVAMQTTRSTNVDDVQLLTVQHLLYVGIWRGAIAVRELLRLLSNHIGHRNQTRIGKAADGLRMRGTDHATTDDPEADLLRHETPFPHTLLLKRLISQEFPRAPGT
jgi:hypothetical protein